MTMLDINERYQEVENNEGALFFIETSDNIKFHIFDKETNELMGKAVVVSSAELSSVVADIITFKNIINT